MSLPAESMATPVLHLAFAVMLTIILAACGTTGSGSAPPCIRIAGTIANIQPGRVFRAVQARSCRWVFATP